MLEILIVKNNKEQRLDVHPDVQIPVTIENPMMLNERIPMPYSLSFEVPPTQHNLAIFNHPNRMGSYRSGASFAKFTAKIRFQSLEILAGSIQLVEYDQNIKLTYKGVDYDEAFRTPLFKLDIGRVQFPGSYTSNNYKNSSNWAFHYLAWANNLTNINNPGYVACPIAITDENQPFTRYAPYRRSEYFYNDKYPDKFGFKNTIRFNDIEHLNAYNAERQTFLIEPYTPVAGLEKYACANIFPQFRVGFLIRKIIGSNLLANPFEQDELRDLVLPTYYFSKWTPRTDANIPRSFSYPPMISNPGNTILDPPTSAPYVDLADYLPNVPSNEFLRQILNTFCCSMVVKSGKLTIKQNSSVINSQTNKNWTSKKIGESKFTQKEGLVYEYGYEDFTKPTLEVGETILVSSAYAMMDYPYELDEDGYYEQVFEIANSGMLINKRLVRTTIDGIPTVGQPEEIQEYYDVLDTSLSNQEEVTGNKYTIKSSIKVLHSTPAVSFKGTENNNNGAIVQKYYVASFEGINRDSRPENISLSFLQGKYHVLGDNFQSPNQYPRLSSYRVSIEDKSLVWEGSQGLLEKYHKEFRNWIEKEKIKVSNMFLLSAIDLHNLDITEKIHVQGRNFFIEKMQFTIRHDRIDPAVVDLIEA